VLILGTFLLIADGNSEGNSEGNTEGKLVAWLDIVGLVLILGALLLMTDGS
jgi:hypothetical protein